jgi:hypothetical protein
MEMNGNPLHTLRRTPALAAILGLLVTGGCATVPAPVEQEVQADEVLAVELWTNRDRAEYAIGETMQLYLRTNENAQVVVFNIDAMNRTTVLFPNDYATQNRLPGGETHALPGLGAAFQFRVVPPAGENLIRVIATTSERPILEPQAMTRGAGPFPGYTQPPEAVVRQVQVVAAEEPGVRWAMQDYRFRVVP